jgi:hypothetical protein
MNFFYHGAILELVFHRVWVMQTSHFKKFLEVVFGQPSLPLDFMFDSHYELLAGIVGSLITVAIVAHCGDAMGSALLPLLATFITFPVTLDSGLGGCGPATIGDRSHVT